MDFPLTALSVATGTRALSVSQRDILVKVLLVAILSLAIGLRLYGLNWDNGFPFTPHPDERAMLMKVGELSPPSLENLSSLLNADQSSWNPRWFPYGSFPLYLLKGIGLVFETGSSDQIYDLRIVGRTISALADVGTVFLVFFVGKSFYGRKAGLISSAFVSLAVLHIQLSHYFTVDTFLTFFVVITLYFLYRVARHGRLRDSFFASVFIGLGLATKISMLPIYGAFIIAHLMYAFNVLDSGAYVKPAGIRWSQIRTGIAVGIIVSLLVLFISQPYTFLDWNRFYADIIEQSEMARRLRDYPYTRQYISTTPYWYHIRQLSTWGLGWPLGITSVAALLYISLRGMQLKYALAFLVSGLCIPALILLTSTGLFAVLGASAIILLALLSTLPVRSRSTRGDVLLLSWVLPFLLITGALQVKFLRYLLPITPILLLFCGRLFCDIWDKIKVFTFGRLLRPWLLVALAVLIGSTAFYALSYTSIYRNPHTAVGASEWIRQNAPQGSIILKEHWEESLPNLGQYLILELPMYDVDNQFKFKEMAEKLAQSDYLILFSNRMYGTISRLPERYPVSSKYYQVLFSSQLGYELVHFQQSYPQLLGINFVNDTFSPVGLSEPKVLRDFTSDTLDLNLGFADESFSVYDHPKVLIFENVERHTVDDILNILEDTRLPERPYPPEEHFHQPLMFSPEEALIQQSGGTWTDIVSRQSWSNRQPVLAWLLIIEIVALLALPLTFYVFRPLHDRGYLFSKIIGIFFLALTVWLLASLKWISFSQTSFIVAVSLLAGISLIALSKTWREIFNFIRSKWSLLLIAELIFLAAFFSFLMIRMANPDLWHPYRGGEKPMDFAYLNAVLRSSYMPPYDPWFSGGYLNYYYWGQFIVAMLIKATGILPETAFNLAIPLFFGLTVAGSFSIGYNLAAITQSRQKYAPSNLGSGQYIYGSRWYLANPRISRSFWSPILAGISAALFVAVLSNLNGAIQVAHSAWRFVGTRASFGQFDFWQSSRMMAPDPPGFEITEFPFFTFLFADLHAHLMAIPFTLAILGLALAIIAGKLKHQNSNPQQTLEAFIRLIVIGLTIGSLRLLNAWDFPTYLIIATCAIFISELLQRGGFSLILLFHGLFKVLLVFGVGYLAFLPFHLNYEAFFSNVEPTTNTTPLWQFLAISGLPIFIIGTFAIKETFRLISPLLSTGQWHISLMKERPYAHISARKPSLCKPILSVSIKGILILLVCAILITVAFNQLGSTVPFMGILLFLITIILARSLFLWRDDAPEIAYVSVMAIVASALVIGLEILRIEGDIDRMNSVFKFYLQVWVLFGLSSAYLLWYVVRRRKLKTIGFTRKIWLGVLLLLLASASVYPILGTQTRLRDHFDGQQANFTLNGLSFMESAVYKDANGDLDLSNDLEGIHWLRNNVEGSPIVLEGITPSYKWGGRVSVYTGLPSVIGWQWHQEQQRWDYREAVSQRIEDVNTIYRTVNATEALSLLQKYGISYIYIGELEKIYYPEEGLRKFKNSLSHNIEVVFHNETVSIYRVSKIPF